MTLASATPGANRVPIANGLGKLAAGWFDGIPAAALALAENAVLLGGAGDIATTLATGAKGRALLAMADDAALAAEVVARIAGQTIAPAQVNATTHVNAPALQIGGTNILARANTWSAVQDASFATNGLVYGWRHTNTSNGASAIAAVAAQNDGGAIARIAVGGSGNTGTLFGVSRANLVEILSTGATLTAIGSVAGDVLLISGGVERARLVSAGIAIGATAISDGARLLAKGGSTPGAPAADEFRFGNGAGRYGAYVDAPSLRYNGTDILARANTWSAQQSFILGTGDALPAAGMFGGEGQIARRIQIGYDVTNDIGRISNIHSATAWKPLAIRASNIRFEGAAGAEILRVVAEGLAIGATAISDSARLLAKGGSTPATPAADEFRFGNGVGRYGSYVQAPHHRSAVFSTAASGTIHDAAVGNAEIIRCPITGALTITGIAGGAEGRKVFIYNTSSANSVTIKNDDSGSIAANRIRCAGAVDYVLTNRAGVTLVYDSVSSFWAMIAK